MIEINLNEKTYVCPFCANSQSYKNSFKLTMARYGTEHSVNYRETNYGASDLDIYQLECSTKSCKKISVVGFYKDGCQIDIIPKCTFKFYPNYVPKQIQQDYKEGVAVIGNSPKAAATLFRRCLQGIVRDFWQITDTTLNKEIEQIKDKVAPSLWQAIDSLRKVGNIGAHMEKDVNLIIDIEKHEVEKMQKLIEKIINDTYISRHESEVLFKEINEISESKAKQKKA